MASRLSPSTSAQHRGQQPQVRIHRQGDVDLRQQVNAIGLQAGVEDAGAGQRLCGQGRQQRVVRDSVRFRHFLVQLHARRDQVGRLGLGVQRDMRRAEGELADMRSAMVRRRAEWGRKLEAGSWKLVAGSWTACETGAAADSCPLTPVP